jgi:hypothetical protein
VIIVRAARMMGWVAPAALNTPRRKMSEHVTQGQNSNTERTISMHDFQSRNGGGVVM